MATNLDKPTSELFVEEGLVSRMELMSILANRSDTREPLGQLLVRLGKINQKQRLHVEGMQMGVPFYDIANSEVEHATARIINHATAMRLLAIPIEKTELAMTVAMVNPLDITAIDELSNLTNLEVDPVLVTEEDLRDAIYRAFGAYDDLGEIVGEAVRGVDVSGLELTTSNDDVEDANISIVELKEVVDGAPVIKLANALLTRAISMRASDIHIEPLNRKVRVRVRIDGLLQEVMSIPKDLQHPLVSRIKVLANLDIAERRVPQDGRCTLIAPQGEFDFRVSTYPCVFGEKVVIRILDKNASTIDLLKLGMAEDTLRGLIPKIEEPQGLVLVTGPTGSGKTTTLYAAVHHLNAVYRNIITIEDPVEYQLDGIVQGNVNPKAGITFATGLKSILRQDPDVILVGEVRDQETASTAIEASLTGHLVLTSLHANDSAAAITRLMDMGVEPFLISASVTCSIAQRLVRTNCPKCQEEYQPEDAILLRLGLSPGMTLIKGRGCDYCAKTGYRGRTGIYEILDVNSNIRRMILAGKHSTEIREAAAEEGMTTLRVDARRKVLMGTTTVEEIMRVTADG